MNLAELCESCKHAEIKHKNTVIIKGTTTINQRNKNNTTCTNTHGKSMSIDLSAMTATCSGYERKEE